MGKNRKNAAFGDQNLIKIFTVRLESKTKRGVENWRSDPKPRTAALLINRSICCTGESS